MADVEIIKKRIIELEKRQEDIKFTRETIKSEMECDKEYQDAIEERKAANAKITQVTLRMMDKFKTSINEMTENKEEVATLKEILDAELQEYAQESGSREIQTENGLRRIVINAKAIKTNQPSLFS